MLADRSLISDLLGFDGLIDHTRDAMWQTDSFINLLSTATSLISNQSKLAEDLEIWASQEFDYIDLAGPYTRSSVLMPQKRNPYSLTIARGAGGVLIGRLAGFLAVVKSPSARSDNLIFAYGEIPRALELSSKISALMSGVVGTMTVNADRMWAELESGFSQATDLAEFVMMTTGVDYRTAYHIVGNTVRAASSDGLRGTDITVELLGDISEEIHGERLEVDSDELAQVLDPRNIVATRTATGGAAPDVVDEMASNYRDQAVDLVARADQRQVGFRTAERELLARAEGIVSSN